MGVTAVGCYRCQQKAMNFSYTGLKDSDEYPYKHMKVRIGPARVLQMAFIELLF